MSDIIIREYPRDNSPLPELPDNYQVSDPLRGINPKATLRVVAAEIVGKFQLITATNGPGAYGNMPMLYAVRYDGSAPPYRADDILDVEAKAVELVPNAGGFRRDQPGRLMVLEVL